jgi:hypothetical protein
MLGIGMSHDESVFHVWGCNKTLAISPLQLDISPKWFWPAWHGTSFCIAILFDMTGRSFIDN